MKNEISVNAKGIKCDHCDFNESEVELENFKEWIEKPCPKCGGNLLTKEDYSALMTLIGLANLHNEIVRFGQKGNEPHPEDEKMLSIRIQSDGQGNLRIIEKENE